MQEHARVFAEALTAEAANARALSTLAPIPVAIISQLKYLCTTRTHANDANQITKPTRTPAAVDAAFNWEIDNEGCEKLKPKKGRGKDRNRTRPRKRTRRLGRALCGAPARQPCIQESPANMHSVQREGEQHNPLTMDSAQAKCSEKEKEVGKRQTRAEHRTKAGGLSSLH